MNVVTVADEILNFPSYAFAPPEAYPMFAENRVHQRSSGNPYPNRVVTRVDRSEHIMRPVRVITLENAYLRIQLMPEYGGRIYSALDKRTGYDFFYKQHVIKPALIGMLGNWISGGCEFNWPCHHRPSTFMPVDVAVERSEDGSATVWMSEHEPLDRMKGMVGISLAPGEARFETRVRLFNRTPERHSFLWWENAAVPVHEDYRLVFPSDVHYVQFHYRKSVTTYPLASGMYNGMDFGQERDLSRHGNTRRPTSFFCAATRYNFFGGYDERRKCGVMHVADHTVSVGKKMFTWAYSQLSRSWEKALTDTDGAYAELMASSYSLNQPDFAWLQPYESRAFSQTWYPVGAMGVPLCAERDCAVSVHDGKLYLQATRAMENIHVQTDDAEVTCTVCPENILEIELDHEPDSIRVRDAQGREILCWKREGQVREAELPDTLPDNPTLDMLKDAEEAYLCGVHVEQYRDPGISPDAYYLEALRREPEYVPALTAMARFELAHMRPEKALEYCGRAWKRVTMRNFHPESGEIQYLMARILEETGRFTEAWEWYMQSAWAGDTRGAALTRAAMLDGRFGHWTDMEEHARQALEVQAGNDTAQFLRVLALKQMGRGQEAGQALEGLLGMDPLHVPARLLRSGAEPAFYDSLRSSPAQSVLDTAEELTEAGFGALALEVLDHLPDRERTMMTEYVRGYLQDRCTAWKKAGTWPVGPAYPRRRLEKRALEAALRARPDDVQALDLLGCLLYDRGHWNEAADLFRRAAEGAPDDVMPRRNLAVALYSHLNRRGDAQTLLSWAVHAHPEDQQLLYEWAHVMLSTGQDPAEVAETLAGQKNLREDLILETCMALNLAGRYADAYAELEKHDFVPCEGGEHAVAEQYIHACMGQGLEKCLEDRLEEGCAWFRTAQELPEHLGAGLWNDVLVMPAQVFEAWCLEKLGRDSEAREILEKVAGAPTDSFTFMHLPEMRTWQAAARILLGRRPEALNLIARILRDQDQAEGRRDAGYYRTTPFFISYMEQPERLRSAACAWQRALAQAVLGNREQAQQEALRSLELWPVNLYARTFVRFLEKTERRE